MNSLIPKKLLFYSFVSSVLVANVSGIHFVYPVYGTLLIKQFHWTNLENSIAGTATFTGCVFSGPLSAYMVERFKIRKTLLISSLIGFTSLFCLAITYLGYLSSNFILCTIYLLLSGFAGGTSYICALDSQSYNFKNSRGISMGMTSAALGMSGFVFSQINDIFFKLTAEGTSVFNFITFFACCYFIILFLGSFILGPLKSEENTHFAQRDHSFNIISSSTISTVVVDADDDDDDNNNEIKPLLKNNPTKFQNNTMKDPPMFSDPIGISLVVSLLVVLGIGYVYLVNLGQLLLCLSRGTLNDEFQHFVNLHVSIFCFTNCGTRVVFGFISDLFQRKYGINRLWFLWLGTVLTIFTIAYLNIFVTNVHQLIPCTVLFGCAFGLIFGLSPPIVSEFGTKSFARNWGWLLWAPAIGGQLFNLLFGIVYHRESKRQENENNTCYGPACYDLTFYVGAIATVFCTLVLSFTIYNKRKTFP